MKKQEGQQPDEMQIAGRVGKAKKDFEIHQGDVHIIIKKGEEISEKRVPKKFWENLKTEGVL